MKRDLWRLEKRERSEIQSTTTHFNIHYNQRSKYKHILTKLEDEIGFGYRKEILALITNTARAIKYRAIGLSVPRDFAPYKGNPQKISHKRMVSLLDILEAGGYVDLLIGGIADWKEGVMVGSLCMFKEPWLSLFFGVDVSDEVDSLPLVEIKDRSSGALKSTRGHTGVKKIGAYMEAFNTILQNTTITKGSLVYSAQQYKRVFSDKIGFGGRHYNTVGGVQVMNSDERKKLELDGSPVAELDFKAMHASLLYEEEYEFNADVIDSWIEDEWGGAYNPYGAKMPFLEVDQSKVNYFREKYNKPAYDPIRNLCKHSLMVCLNEDSYRGAFTQVTGEVVRDKEMWGTDQEKDSKFFGLCVSDRFPGHTVCQAVVAHNKPIAHHFFNDRGVQLQYLDSEIIADVINRLICEKEPLLPEHDSVIVKQEVKERVMQYMREAYKEVMGNDKFCYIEEK